MWTYQVFSTAFLIERLGFGNNFRIAIAPNQTFNPGYLLYISIQ